MEAVHNLTKMATLTQKIRNHKICNKRNVQTAARAAIVTGAVALYATDEQYRRRVQAAWQETRASVGDYIKGTATPTPKPVSPSAASYPNARATAGVVYLLQAGPFYKIGKATDLQRRLHQIKLQLPYPVKLIHTIHTRDIGGVETYWHKRFAHQRSNGEWFTLNDAEVAEFQTHSTM